MPARLHVAMCMLRAAFVLPRCSFASLRSPVATTLALLRLRDRTSYVDCNPLASDRNGSAEASRSGRLAGPVPSLLRAALRTLGTPHGGTAGDYSAKHVRGQLLRAGGQHC